eukprot:4640871-Prymnesium_polylepis.1
MWRRCLDDGRPLLRLRLHAREPYLQGPRAQGARRPERPPARPHDGRGLCGGARRRLRRRHA